MKTLSNHTLVYDSECPMCDLYTKGFIKTGMLGANGRVKYGCAKVPASFDNTRALNEIALIDYNNGTVIYGLNSLIKVVSHSFPLAGRILNSQPVYFFFNLLYSFISYNRKVIAPPAVFEKRGACTPAYKISYRLAYIIFAWIATSLILSQYPSIFFDHEFLICGGQVFFQMAIVLLIDRHKLVHYIGNMMTVSLIGALLLLPVVILNNITPVDPMIVLGWFAMVVTFMLFIHWRRVKWLGMSGWATVSWVVYRLIVLCIILL